MLQLQISPRLDMLHITGISVGFLYIQDIVKPSYMHKGCRQCPSRCHQETAIPLVSV